MKVMENWKTIKSISDVEEIIQISNSEKVIIFKHSTRCNISEDAYHELSKGDFSLYYLDLLSYREVSDYIATTFNIKHQSPQVLIIDKGECIYNESHWRIKNEIIHERIKS